MKKRNTLIVRAIPPPSNLLTDKRLRSRLNLFTVPGKSNFKFLLLIFMIMNFGIQINAQQNTAVQKQQFEKQMNTYITTQLKEKVQNLKQNPQMFENFEEYTAEDLESIAREDLKNEYIQHNMKEYLNTYFSDPQAMVNADTFVCDNGGFEQDFMYYKGYTSMYDFGSDSCTPYTGYPGNGSPSVFIPAQLPTARRFEIVTSGTDPLTGLQKVKFGNKSLRINDRYGHLSTCQGDYGVDKIVKRFKVTKENRDFTVWYSVALENPSGHENRQPFLNIKCDLAPDNELCFDADIIQCAQYLDDPQCTFDSIDVLDWSCHRFKIPEDKIGQIATLEMIIGDCGLGAHFGYAYIDGICEECDSSALGSATLDEDIDYRSCDGLTARICGTYTPPTICSNGGNWAPSEVTVPGYDITNVTIDTASKTFCFDFPISNFGNEDCLEIYAEIVFNNGVFDLPEVLTNSIDICKKLYTKSHNYTIEIGGCDDNETPDLLSDDYYKVRLNILAPESDSWILERHLIDPYSNESGSYTLMTGSGDAQLELGPFLIQEGDWWLEISFSDCEYNELIEAPPYCVCEQFQGTEISNVHCIKNEQGDDTWSFDFIVKYSNNAQYKFTPKNEPTEINNYNKNYTIDGGNISDGCKEFTLENSSGSCTAIFEICPPKPCSEECNLEAYVVDVICINDNNFLINMDISGIGNKQLCSDPGYFYYYPYYLYYLYEDTYINLKLCDYGENCNTCQSNCYKTIFVPKPDCDYDPWKTGENLRQSNFSIKPDISYDDVDIYPNPVVNNEIIIRSKLEKTHYSIYNTAGNLIKEGTFTDSEYRINFENASGLYFVKYINKEGKPAFKKIIKLQ
ncbi:MAG TPA: T9SS type A sorting domain-containing protein [Bacteroidetes bacterium]|nr:T9SS type A sorting domain-containing protein [Bacteroidota bacterium]